MCKKKFTLIELLVVIAIIGILASMLMPSLAKARYSTRIAVCASNIGQCGKGLTLYTADSSDKLPPVTSAFEGSPWVSYETKKAGEFYNLGSIYSAGYIDTNVQYCPQSNLNGFSGASALKYTHDYNVEDGELTIPSGDSRTRSSYLFAVMEMTTDQRNSLSMTQLDEDKILFSDNFLSQTRTAHREFNPGWNVMKPDMGVKFIRNKTVYNFVSTSIDNNWSGVETVEGYFFD